MNKPLLIVMCGLQCSGKSTIAEVLSLEHNAIILSSDKIRLEFPDAGNDFIFKRLYNQMNIALEKGINVIIDATNTTIKMRRQIFLNLKVECEKICYIMNTSYNECKKRLEVRNYRHNIRHDIHYVPEEVLQRYYYNFELPFYEEGWDKIIVHNESNPKHSEETLLLYKDLAKGFNQKNKHHCQDLGQHMETVGDIVKNESSDWILIKAAYYHDVGKLFTQTLDEEGQGHYYNHANVGAYNILCNCALYVEYLDGEEKFEYRVQDTINWIFYINYHMHLFNCTTDKSIKKWKSIFGEQKFNELKLLNKADKTREGI